MLRILFFLPIATTLQAVTTEDLKSIFHTPKRDYDDLEILERSNFESDDSSAPQNEATPRCYSNAQVLVRFGEDKPKCGCGCGCNCNCGMCRPLVYCLCPVEAQAPPTSYTAPPAYQLATNEMREYYAPPVYRSLCVEYAPPPVVYHLPIVSTNENKPSSYSSPVVYQLKPSVEAVANDIQEKHYAPPQVVTNEIKPSVEEKQLEKIDVKNINNIVDEDVKNKEHPTILKSVQLSEDVEKGPKPRSKDLDKCLIPYKDPKLPKAKLLVTYPIFETGVSSEKVNREHIPVGIIPNFHGKDCKCYSCAVYVGELNEKSL